MVPVLLPDRKFDENFDGAKRLDPVRAPSRPAPPEFELALTLIAKQFDLNEAQIPVKTGIGLTRMFRFVE